MMFANYCFFQKKLEFQKKHYFDVPLSLNPSDNEIYLEDMLCNLCKGDDGEENVFIPQKIEEVSYCINSEIEITEIHVHYGNNGEDELAFGAEAIKENMAYILERVCCPGCYKSPDYPYRSAEIISDFFVPGFSTNLLNVFALCDMSLQTTNPGKSFCDVMKKFKDEKITGVLPSEIYDFFYRSISFLKYENYNEMLKETQRSLKKIPIGSNVVVQSYYTWINTIFNFVRKIRFEDKLYLLKMCLSDKPLKNNEYFVRMLNLIGGPLIKHNDCYYKFQNGKVDVEFGFARMQVQNVLFGGIQKCDLYE